MLATNRDDLVRLSGRARPVLEVLERYSGVVPCVLRALEAGNKLANLASGVRGPYIGLTIDMVVDQDPYTYPDDLPDDPRADSNLKNLPPSVPSFAPHCPVLPKRVTDRSVRRRCPTPSSPTHRPLTVGAATRRPRRRRDPGP